MRATIVALVLSVSVSASADQKLKKQPPLAAEAQLVKDFFEATHAAPDKAIAQLAASVQQAVVIRPSNCIKKVQAKVATAATKKQLVKCLGEWADAETLDGWAVKKREDIHPEGPSGFAKKLPKDAKLVMGSYSDGFILVGLDASQKIIGVFVDLSAAE